MSVRVTPYKGKQGGWEVDVRVRLASGKRHREKKVLTVSKSNAKRWGEERERFLLQHGPATESKEVPTLAEFSVRFMNDYARANRQKPSTISQKDIALRVHILPLLGTKRLDAITTADVQRLKDAMRQKAVKTVNNVLTVLGRLLRVAVEWDVLERMPCSVRLLRNPEGRMQFWDFEQYERLVDAAAGIDTRTSVAILLGGDAGLRAGEIRALEWADIDLKARKLVVARSEWRGQIGTTKGNRMRMVPLTDRLAEGLRRHRSLKSERVVCDDDGRPLTANGLAYLIERATRAAGLAATRKPKGAGPHVLRHTFCSHLAMQGAPARAIQELAGHRDLQTTQRYMHLGPATLDSAIALLNRRKALPWGAGGETEAVETANA